MPTFETLPRFTADLQHLTPAQRRRFRRAVLGAFATDLRTGRQFRHGLRIKGVRCVYGLGTGRPRDVVVRPGGGRRDPNVVWHRIGTHSILDVCLPPSGTSRPSSCPHRRGDRSGDPYLLNRAVASRRCRSPVSGVIEP